MVMAMAFLLLMDEGKGYFTRLHAAEVRRELPLSHFRIRRAGTDPCRSGEAAVNGAATQRN